MKSEEILLENDNFSLISNIKNFIISQNELGFHHNEILIEHCVQKNQHGELILTWRIDRSSKYVYNWDYREFVKIFGTDIRGAIKGFLKDERDKLNRV